MHPYQLALLVDASATLGQTSAALEAATSALDIVERTGERWFEAELVRIRSDLTLELARMHSTSRGRGVEIEVEKMLRDAIDIASRQQARSFKLRAATSLGRVLLERGRPEPGRALLAEIYDSFTEGHDTADLRAAWKALGEIGARR